MCPATRNPRGGDQHAGPAGGARLAQLRGGGHRQQHQRPRPVAARAGLLRATGRTVPVPPCRGHHRRQGGRIELGPPPHRPRAELIAVVDADYHVGREWLRRTVGFFDDPRRASCSPQRVPRCHHSRFSRWPTGSTGSSSRPDGLPPRARCRVTVGTISVIRLQALHGAGGWAEWCQTEDSELAIRIHDVGYGSVYLTEPGPGPHPGTFEAYRNQRIAGPTGRSGAARHWRRFLPRWLGATPSHLTPAQKLHHANYQHQHHLRRPARLDRLPRWAPAPSPRPMLIHHEPIPMPGELWVAATVCCSAAC